MQGRIQTFLVGSFSGGSAGAGAGTAGSAGSGSGLESLPCSLLEEVLARCSSAAGLAAAACTCRAFRKVGGCTGCSEEEVHLCSILDINSMDPQ